MIESWIEGDFFGMMQQLGMELKPESMKWIFRAMAIWSSARENDCYQVFGVKVMTPSDGARYV